jgi:hypothetical protein
MTDRTWIGGTNNKASNPKDWSPTGVPQQGDRLFITGSFGAVPPNGTLNITGNDLAGDILTAGSVPTHSIVTINLSHDASLDLETLVGDGIVVIPQSTTINVKGAATLTGDALFWPATQTINIGANSTLTVSHLNATTIGPGEGTTVVINGAAHGKLNVQGAGAIVNYSDSTMTVNAPVIGAGTFDDDGSLTFSNSVTSGITVELTAINSSTLMLDHPLTFNGTVDDPNAAGQQGFATIDLAAIHATTYDYGNGVLTLLKGNHVVDRLDLKTNNPVLVAQNTSGITILTGNGTPPASAGTLLSVHSPALLLDGVAALPS